MQGAPIPRSSTTNFERLLYALSIITIVMTGSSGILHLEKPHCLTRSLIIFGQGARRRYKRRMRN